MNFDYDYASTKSGKKDSYGYYCTHCGKRIGKDVVLFDLSKIITVERMNVFSFYVNEAELHDIVSKGEKQSDGFSRCTISFDQMINFAANERNLNNPILKTLKLSDIEDYTQNSALKTQKKEKKNSNSIFGDDEDIFSGDDDDEPNQEAYHDNAQNKTIEAVIQVLIDASKKMQGASLDKSRVISDLTTILGAFLNTAGKIVVSLKSEYEEDSRGGEVLIGYYSKNGNDSVHSAERFCPDCKKIIFEHAGTAKHQAITFIGYRTSGKTSTILAISSYVRNALTNFGDIWCNSGNMNKEILHAQLLSSGKQLEDDLKLFEKHIAPTPTGIDSGTKAYTTTFRVKNRFGVYHIITLSDLPGECFEDDGKLKEKELRNQYPMAYSCDAYIACFDAHEDKMNKAVAEASNICEWADSIQKMRTQFKENTSTYVPLMLLFTKSEELEKKEYHPFSWGKISNNKGTNPFDNTFVFNEEKKEIVSENQLFEIVEKALKNTGDLKNAYHAIMRCSPYGYAAPKEEEIMNESKEVNENAKPIHVDLLMRWILCVSGAIPVYATFHGLEGETYSTNEYTLTRPQIRWQNPIVSEKNSDLNKECDYGEALSRVFLFDNPGYWDKRVVEEYGEFAAQRITRFKMKQKKNENTNASEE